MEDAGSSGLMGAMMAGTAVMLVVLAMLVCAGVRVVLRTERERSYREGLDSVGEG